MLFPQPPKRNPDMSPLGRYALAFSLFLPALALADPATDAAACQASAGSMLTGKVTQAPHFVSGHKQKGVFLSHTHVTLLGDDGTTYDVAMDNVFANGYRKNQPVVPAPLNTIQVGDRLELCGQLYTGGDVGIHWVHTNCGVPASPDKPDGWVREVAADGSVSANMESNPAFCSLWPN